MLGSVKGNLGHLNTAAGEESKNHIQHFFSDLFGWCDFRNEKMHLHCSQ